MSGRRPYLCLDFQFDRLAAIEVESDRVVRWLVQPLPEGSFDRGQAADPAALGGAVRAILGRAGVRAAASRVVIPDDGVVTRVLELPAMKDSELRGAVRYLAEKEIPISIERAAWSWDVVGSTAGTIRVMLVATWEDRIQRVRETVRAAGLRLEVVEPRALTIARALQLESGVVLETSGEVALMTVLDSARAAFTAQGTATDDGALMRLLRRGEDHRLLRAVPEEGIVVVAGDLDQSTLKPAQAVSAQELLNGHAPTRPATMPASHLLAPLGLAMRGTP